MSRDTVLANANVVLDDEIVRADVHIRDGLIADVCTTPTSVASEDFDGDYLVPGVVELHTDHLEYHFSPRPGVQWDPVPAVLAHDAQMAAAGATTVFDAVRIGSEGATSNDEGAAAAAHRLVDAVMAASDGDMLRADHAIHLRCEVSSADCADVFSEFVDNPRIRLASLMDHTPGQRQFADVDEFKRYYLGKGTVLAENIDAHIAFRRDQSAQFAVRHRQLISGLAADRGITLAAHDDATQEHIDESMSLGVHISEFPTTVLAAEAATANGLQVVMGAPNIVRGGSQSGNVAAAALLERGLLHVLSSDYVPSSPLQAVFQLAADHTLDLVDGIKLVSANPARAVGLDDRGEIAVGQRADLVRVRAHDLPATERHLHGRQIPIVRAVYRAGARTS